MSSADLRLFAKQIVRRPRPTSPASSRDASPSALARSPSSGVEERRVPERDRPLGARRRVVLDDGRLLAGQRARELAGVRDRRRGEQELRLGAVDPREPAQPPQDVRDVRAEDAAVDVRLVDDDEAEVVEEVAPQVVARQDADVEHVGVREHEVRPAADLPAPLGRRVAVVDRRADAGDAELPERARLILRERLRRVEVERARVPVGRERVEHREVERERLPRGGARRDDDVAAARGRGVRFGLVRVELVDPAARERLAQRRMEASRAAALSAPRARARSRGARARPRRGGRPRWPVLVIRPLKRRRARPRGRSVAASMPVRSAPARARRPRRTVPRVRRRRGRSAPVPGGSGRRRRRPSRRARASGAWIPAKPSSSTRPGPSPSSSRIRGVAEAARAGGRRCIGTLNHDEAAAHRHVPRHSVRLAAADVGALQVALVEHEASGRSSCRGRSAGGTTSTSPRSRAVCTSGVNVRAPGCLAARLRSHPSNLIRVMPAKGVRWFHAASRSRAPTPAEAPGSRPTSRRSPPRASTA